MPHKWKVIYDRDRTPGANVLSLNENGDLVGTLKPPKGMHRFKFEVDRGTFDADMMFFRLYGVRVGPSTIHFRVGGYSDATEKTRYLKESIVCPSLDIYQDRNFIGAALTEFPSHKEFARGFHFGEFALEFEGREYDVRLINGRGYRLDFRRVLMRRDERLPRRRVELKRSVRGKHPRLYFTGRRQLRAWSRERSPERWKHFLRLVNERFDDLAAGKDTGARDVSSFALAYLVTDRRKYFDVASRAMQVLLTEEMPGPDAGRLMYRSYGVTEPGELIETAACFYDWCHNELEPAWRDLIRASIVRVMRWWMPFIKFQSLEWPGNPGGMLHSAYNYHALGIAGIVFHDEVEEAGEWLDWAVRHYDIARQRTAKDGSGGFFPRDHAFPSYLDFASALLHTTGFNQLDGWRFFENVPSYRIARETTDMEQVGSMVQDYPPNYVAWEALAALTGDPRAQWLAERYMAKALKPRIHLMPWTPNCPVDMFMRRFLFHDPEIPADAGFGELPLDRHFRDTDQILSRSDWLDGDETIVCLWSGTEAGHVVQDLEYRVSTCGFPAANALTMNAYGEGLVEVPPFSYSPHTANYSTLTVEDDGQMEQGTVFGCTKDLSRVGRIVGFHSARSFAYGAGEAAQCYEPEVGLRQFTRHMIHLKREFVVVFDQVVLSRARAAATHWGFNIVEMTAKFRGRRRHSLSVIDDHTAFFAGHSASLVVSVPRAQKQTISIEPMAIARSYDDKTSDAARVTVSAAKARKHRFLTVLLPLPERTRKHIPRIEEFSDTRQIAMRIQQGNTRTLVLMPRTKTAVRCPEGRFQGDLLVVKWTGDVCTAACALGVKSLDIDDVPSRTLSEPANLFAERVQGRWRIKKRKR